MVQVLEKVNIQLNDGTKMKETVATMTVCGKNVMAVRPVVPEILQSGLKPVNCLKGQH